MFLAMADLMESFDYTVCDDVIT